MIRITLILLACYSVTVSADAPDTGFWSFQIENDVFGSGDDRFYTNGFEITFASIETPPSFLKEITNRVPFYRKGKVGVYGYSIGQKMFTPEDTQQRELIEDERPYAGWLFLDAGIAHVFEDSGDRQSINGLLLTFGVVGPRSMAEETQKEFHRFIGAEIPQGWDNQLHDELGLNITYFRKWKRLFPLKGSRQFEISHHGGVSLGNVFTYASAGVVARWGTHLENDIGPPNINPGFPGIPAFRPDPAPSWYFFAGIEGRLVGRNIFLDGNTFRDSHSVDKENLVGDLQFGFAFHIGDVRIAFSNVIRSKEFEGQQERARFGAINLTFYTN
ncbi:MAG: lipid A deacylase LpxR family protein [Candidatus Thiodiazotropha endolucinida]